MEPVILVVHLMLALAIIGLILLQKSEGGGLGIGGGGGGLTTAQGAKHALTRATSICAACFFGTSLILGILAGTHHQEASILDQVSDSPVPAIVGEEIPGAVKDAQEKIREKTDDIEADAIPSAPVSE